MLVRLTIIIVVSLVLRGLVMKKVGLLLFFWASLGMAAEQSMIDWNAYKGKVVYVDFWASWCGPCKASFPWMMKMHEQKKSQGLVILAINVDQDKKVADKFLMEFNPKFPIIFDAKGALAEEFKVQTMPSSFLIDKAGKPRFKHAGFFESKTAAYEKEIQQLLEE